jgi:hypothetical protein
MLLIMGMLDRRGGFVERLRRDNDDGGLHETWGCMRHAHHPIS